MRMTAPGANRSSQSPITSSRRSSPCATNKLRYAQAEARARANRPPRPPWFDVMQHSMAFDDSDESD